MEPRTDERNEITIADIEAALPDVCEEIVRETGY